MNDDKIGTSILKKAFEAWNNSANLRLTRNRNKRFTYGDQWSDPAPDPKANSIERDAIIRSGKQPYTNNLIRQLVKTIVGRFRRSAVEEGLYEGDIEHIAYLNQLDELDARMLEEFLISGCAIQRIACERRWGGKSVWIDNVDLNRFFVSSFRDPRGWDINLIGMVHLMSFAEIVNRFADGDPAREGFLKSLYTGSNDSTLVSNPQDDFFFAFEAQDYCRVIEVWSVDTTTPEPDKARREFVWHCRFIAPDGTILAEYDSPFKHGSHPFVVKFYPLTDGEVHAFVEDVIDQQKFINRIIVMLDHILACSAKGVLLFPESELPNSVSWEDVFERWARADGVIPIKGTSGTLPVQLSANSANAGAFQLLQLQMQLFDKISGVGEALSGADTTRNTGAQLFDAKVRNATIAIADLFDSFKSFARQRSAKALNSSYA